MMDHSYAVQCLRVIHETISPIVCGLAQDKPISRADRMALRRLPSVTLALLEACELPGFELQPARRYPVYPEGSASRALGALLEATSSLLSACARAPAERAMDNDRLLTAIHAMAWELVFALGLQGE